MIQFIFCDARNGRPNLHGNAARGEKQGHAGNPARLFLRLDRLACGKFECAGSRGDRRHVFFARRKTRCQGGILAGHIRGAVFFDIEAIADHTTNLPHMLPHPENFAEAMEKLGLGDEMRFVVYDASNLQGGARVWWTLRVFGARDVKILAGGLPRWRAEGRPLEPGARAPRARLFSVNFDKTAVADAGNVEDASKAGSAQVLDARGREV